MIRWYYKHRIGTIWAKTWDGQVCRVNIFGGNCLCVFTQFFMEDGKEKELYISFYNDEKYVKNIYKEYGKIAPVDNIISVSLNLYYKEAVVLAKYLAMSGYKVRCYYKDMDKKKTKK